MPHLQNVLPIGDPARLLGFIHCLHQVNRKLVAILDGHAAALPQIGLHSVRAVSQECHPPLQM